MRRRRAGRFWPGEPVEVDLSEADLAVLRSDPMLIVRAPRLGDDAAPVSGDTVESLRAELVEARGALAASRAAHEADVASLRGPCDSCESNLASMLAACAERDALRKQVAALEEAATAPTTTGKKK